MFKRNKKKYLIAFDMDGTLLKSDNTVGKKSRRIIKKLVKMGNYVTVASGRPVRVILSYYEDLGLNGPIVSYNGSLVSDPSDSSFVPSKRLFPKEIIIDFLNKVGYDKIDNVLIETEKAIISKKKDQTLQGFYHKEGMEERIGDVRTLIDDDCFICVLSMADHKFDERLVNAAFYYPNMGLRFWGGVESNFSELYWLDVSKTYGLEQARQKLGLSKDQIIVVGDADNDVEMLTEYPHSIAMINGENQVKKRASTVSKYDNNHDGAAIAVYEMIKKLRKENWRISYRLTYLDEKEIDTCTIKVTSQLDLKKLFN